MWHEFWRNETIALYSVNNIFGAHVGRLPFVLILGLLAVGAPLILALRGGRGYAGRARRAAWFGLFVGAFLFSLRSSFDQARNVQIDRQFLGGKTLTEKRAALDPPGFFPLLLEAKRRIPPGSAIELRAPKPFPWEKGGYYLYPSRVQEGAPYIVSYRTKAPSDSISCELLFRRSGGGSIYRRLMPP